MKKRTRIKKIKHVFKSEKDYQAYYQTLSQTYKAITLHNWKKLFSEMSETNNILAASMLKWCLLEEEKLIALKHSADEKLDELLFLKKE